MSVITSIEGYRRQIQDLAEADIVIDKNGKIIKSKNFAEIKILDLRFSRDSAFRYVGGAI